MLKGMGIRGIYEAIVYYEVLNRRGGGFFPENSAHPPGPYPQFLHHRKFLTFNVDFFANSPLQMRIFVHKTVIFAIN